MAQLTITEKYRTADDRIFDMELSDDYRLSLGPNALRVKVAQTSSQAIKAKCNLEREAWERNIPLNVIIVPLGTPEP